MNIGAIEAGGTKFICGIFGAGGALLSKARIETTHPDETLARCLEFFKKGPPVGRMGIASFGPLDLNKRSPTYGSITSTPKPGWKFTNLVAYFSEKLSIPVTLDTDVNGAALAEACEGAAKGLQNVVYYTIGTGIGGGALVNGALVHGLVHPEMGHIPVVREEGDTFPGRCPYHRDCLEGMASGPAVVERWKRNSSELDEGELYILAGYIAQAVVASVLLLSPERVILGGGAMQEKKLFPLIRARVKKNLAGYVASSVFEGDLGNYIVPPGLGDEVGIIGARLLAERER